LSAITGLVEDAGDRIFVMNPSREDPKHVVAHSFGGSKSKVIAIPGNSGPKRAILTTLGIVRGSNVLYPVPFSNSSSKLIKQLAMIPIKGKWERAGNFLGTAFRLAKLQVNTFGSTSVPPLTFRTFPGEPASDFVDDDAKGLDVSDREEGSSSQIKSGPARSYIDMCDRTTWGHDDTTGKLVSDGRFSYDAIYRLPRLDEELEPGDLALVFYSASTYSIEKDKRQTTPSEGLSLNLYGAMLVARKSR
ncbi:hypothetical protein C8Q76DRAFT_620290, partial [Earliella scabrosa]